MLNNPDKMIELAKNLENGSESFNKNSIIEKMK
jgi:hypothetical protein